MRLNVSPPVAAIAVAGCLLAGADTSAGAATTSVTARGILTEHETLRGTMTFRTPRAWHTTAASEGYTARFTSGDAQCRLAISASIRAKATRRSAAAQARASIGANPAAAGRRAHGVYRVGTTSAGWLHGIAVVRVAPRRFGQLRIEASLKGPDCSAAAAPDGALTRAMTSVLHHARTHLRVART
jgi:hypothetical protein